MRYSCLFHRTKKHLFIFYNITRSNDIILINPIKRKPIHLNNTKTSSRSLSSRTNIHSMNRLRILLFCLFSIAFFTNIQAQKPKPKDFGIKSGKAMKLYFEGRQQIQWRTYDKAIELFEEAIEIEPEFAEARLELGQVLVIRQRYDEALPHLEFAKEKKPGYFRGMDFYLGQAYFFNEKYDEAIPVLEKYLEEGRGGPAYMLTAGINLRKAQFAAIAKKNPVPFEPVNLGKNVNSPGHDVTPSLTADGQMMLYISRRKGSTGGFSPRQKDYPEDLYMVVRGEDGNWQPAKNLGEPINTPGNEGAPSFSQDGRYLYFTACSREDGFGNCDLYVSEWTGEGWSMEKNLGEVVNSISRDKQPSLSHDGRFLYFASTRPGGYGGDDIWVTEKVNGEWTEPRNMGESINTPGNEDAPFIHADGQTLYFASDFHNGFGERDIFVSYRYSDSLWTDPKNLGYPINTAGQEGYIFVNSKGTEGYINSVRDGGLGKNDIYRFTLPEDIQPQRATFLRGVVVDSLTRAPIPEAMVRLIDVETGDTIREVPSGRGDGRFLMSLPMDKSYAAHVEAPGYLFGSKHFYLKNLPEDLYFDIRVPLEKIKKGATITLRNIFFETGSYTLSSQSTPELRLLRNYLRKNRRMQVEIQGHTDNVGNDDANQLLSENRAKAVRQWLIEHDIEADRVTAVGYGESQPVADNDTELDRARNRRTEFKVVEN
jgi:outer membrane protein OmpA-like peptidoglycan-associated protein